MIKDQFKFRVNNLMYLSLVKIWKWKAVWGLFFLVEGNLREVGVFVF